MPTLRSFSKWWLAHTPVDPPKDCAKLARGGFEFILWRGGQYQAELIALFPDAVVPAHRHPHVETYEVHYSHSGGHAWLNMPGSTLPDPQLDRAPMARKLLIRAGVWHGGQAGGLTTAISLQRWNGAEPTFISDDWEGDAWV